MAGHNKWTQIKRQKAVTDSKKEQSFFQMLQNYRLGGEAWRRPDDEF